MRWTSSRLTITLGVEASTWPSSSCSLASQDTVGLGRPAVREQSHAFLNLRIKVPLIDSSSVRNKFYLESFTWLNYHHPLSHFC